jgi:hypothetical protein
MSIQISCRKVEHSVGSAFPRIQSDDIPYASLNIHHVDFYVFIYYALSNASVRLYSAE